MLLHAHRLLVRMSQLSEALARYLRWVSGENPQTSVRLEEQASVRLEERASVRFEEARCANWESRRLEANVSLDDWLMQRADL